MADYTDILAVLGAIHAEREEIHALKIGERMELPQQVHFADQGEKFDLILTVQKRKDKPKT